MQITERIHYSTETLDHIKVRRHLDDDGMAIEVACGEIIIHQTDLSALIMMLTTFAEEIRREQTGEE